MIDRREFLIKTGATAAALEGLWRAAAARDERGTRASANGERPNVLGVSSADSLASPAIDAARPAPAPPNGIHVICLSSLPKRPDCQDIMRRILELDYASGLLVYVDWSRFEPEEGEYNWLLFDAPLQLAREQGKVAAFGLMVQAISPPWLMKRCQTFTFEHIHPSVGVVTSPIPWDPSYKAALAKTIGAIGERLDGNPALHYMSVNGPSSLYGVETNFPVKKIKPEEAAKLDYTPEKFEVEWKEAVDLSARFFPRSSLALGLHDETGPGPGDREARMRVARSIRDYALAREARGGKRLIVRLLGLSEDNPKRFPGPYKGSGDTITDYVALVWEVRGHAGVAFEAARVFHLPNVGGKQKPLTPEEFDRVLRIGYSYDANWLEIKQPDVWDIRTNAPYAPYAPLLIETNRRLKEKRRSASGILGVNGKGDNP